MPNILVTGANRGLGLEFTRQYAADGWDVVATCRDPDTAQELQNLANDRPSLRIEKLDVTDHQSIDELATRMRGETIDVLLNNAGIIGPLPIPENIGLQHFGSIDYELWERVMRTNTFAPIKMAEAFLPQIRAGAQKKIVSLSSTVGSIVERDTPAMAYATSKTALNKALSLLASQLHEEGIIVAIFCPGYVQTRMDFGTADVTPPQSVRGLKKLIAEAGLSDSGRFRRFNGETVAW